MKNREWIVKNDNLSYTNYIVKLVIVLVYGLVFVLFFILFFLIIKVWVPALVRVSKVAFYLMLICPQRHKNASYFLRIYFVIMCIATAYFLLQIRYHYLVRKMTIFSNVFFFVCNAEITDEHYWYHGTYFRSLPCKESFARKFSIIY